jgi:hypothetical protein
MSALWAGLALCSTYAAGDVVARATCRDEALRRGLACVLGPAIIAWVAFVGSLAGVTWTTVAFRALGCVTLVVWLASAWRTRRSSDAAAPALPTPWFERVARVAVPVACLALGITFVAWLPPANDAFSNWGLKALALARDGSVRTPDLVEDGRFLFHPNYPLVVPLAQAFVHGCVGEPAEGPARGVFLLAQLGAGLALFGALRTRVSPRLAALAGAMLIATPQFWRSGIDFRFPGSIPAGYADPMFTALVAATLATALTWAQRRDARSAAMLGACVGFALFTKNEGQPLTIALAGAGVLALAVTRFRASRGGDLRTLGVTLVVATALAAPWFAYRAQLPARDENYQEQITTERLEANAWRGGVIVRVAVGEALAVDRHGVAWIALAGALVLCVRRIARPAVVFTLAVLCAMAVAYALVFVVTPLPIVDSLATSIPRTFFHMAPLAIAAIALLCDPREGEP